MNKIFVMALIGAVIIILLASFNVLIGLANSDALKNYGLYVREGKYDFAQINPEAARYETIINLVYGSVGLFAGAIAIIGGRARKVTGGVFMLVACAISLYFYTLWGTVPFALLLTGGILTLRETPAGRNQAISSQ